MTRMLLVDAKNGERYLFSSLLSCTGVLAIRLSDRLFLVALVGLGGAGQYAVAAQVSSVCLVLLSAFNRAWTPYLFPRLNAPTEEMRIAKALARAGLCSRPWTARAQYRWAPDLRFSEYVCEENNRNKPDASGDQMVVPRPTVSGLYSGAYSCSTRARWKI